MQVRKIELNFKSNKPFDSLRVSSAINSNSGLKSEVKKDSFENTSMQKQKPKQISLIVASIIGAFGTGVVIAKMILNKKVSSSVLDELLNSQQIKSLKSQINLFPKDIDYRKILAKSLGLEEVKYYRLRSVIGPQEYENIIKSSSRANYFPGSELIQNVQDAHNLTGVKNCTYRANLHMHTVHSDGKLTVEALLEQAANYADKVAAKLECEKKSTSAPFTIAITDHDTVEGCKEAVKLIAENPLKYKNLRVVLGSELSVENNAIPNLVRPIDMHMLIHSINPFDKNLNALLDKKKDERFNLINQIIAQAKAKIALISPLSAEKLSYDDASRIHPVLRLKLTHVYNAVKDYLQFKTIFTDSLEGNPKLLERLSQKGVDLKKLDYKTPMQSEFFNFELKGTQPFWMKYEKALQKFVATSLEIPIDEASKMVKVDEKIKPLLQEIENIAYAYTPKMKLTEGYVSMKEALNILKESSNGYAGIAHPGMTKIGDYLNDKSLSEKTMGEMFRTFKELGEDRALFAEIHYPYYGELGKSEKWLNLINEATQKNSLYSTGGMDTHGVNIFYSQI